jgi:hypothetical protein
VNVDFVVNCYERTYREVLTPGWFNTVAEQHLYPFSRRVLLVNNTNNPEHARNLADERRADGEIDAWHFVADLLPAALHRTGLTMNRLRRLPHFSDCCLAAVSLDGPEWLLYWDTDARLIEPHDWITPTIAYMRERDDIAVGNPNNWHHGLAQREATEMDGDFAVGYGFSDHGFLVRRKEWAAPIYRRISPASWRYPLSATEPIFEQRADAYMRRTGRKRATYLGAQYTHSNVGGINYPRQGIRERLRGAAQSRLGTLAAASTHPAMRAWPPTPRVAR